MKSCGMGNIIGEMEQQIGDEQSKFIYQNRRNHSITGDEIFLEKIVDYTVRKRSEWSDFRKGLEEKSRQNKIVMFGAGIWGDILWRETKDIIAWEICIDSFPQGKDFPIPIISFSDFMKNYDGEYIAVLSFKSFDSMYGQLMKAGIRDEKIIRAGHVINLLTEGGAYFDFEGLLPVRDEEVFVDGGCFDGFTTLAFYKWSKGKGYSYCFEMDKNNIETIQSNLEGITGYEIVPKAMRSERRLLSLSERGNYASCVSPDIGKDSICVEADTLDFMLKGKNVTYIKMDIEGAELEALKGAKEIIMKQSPRLAISAYHRSEDIWAIPALIHEYNPNYKFYFRHYSFSWYDTVLYAVVKEDNE